MPQESRVIRPGDPTNPHRDRNLDGDDWDPLKLMVTKYHLLGATRAQIIELLAAHHDFVAS